MENSIHLIESLFGCGYLTLFYSFTRKLFKKSVVTTETIWELPQKCGKRKSARNERETRWSYPLKTPRRNVENILCGKFFLPVSACEISC